jgi:hypothetical protein
MIKSIQSSLLDEMVEYGSLLIIKRIIISSLELQIIYTFMVAVGLSEPTGVPVRT